MSGFCAWFAWFIRLRTFFLRQGLQLVTEMYVLLFMGYNFEDSTHCLFVLLNVVHLTMMKNVGKVVKEVFQVRDINKLCVVIAGVQEVESSIGDAAFV